MLRKIFGFGRKPPVPPPGMEPAPLAIQTYRESQLQYDGADDFAMVTQYTIPTTINPGEPRGEILTLFPSDAHYLPAVSPPIVVPDIGDLNAERVFNGTPSRGNTRNTAFLTGGR